MSQASQNQGLGSQDDGGRHWLENILPLLTEARGMFAGDDEVNKLYEVEEKLQQSDEARSKELDGLREKLRGKLTRQYQFTAAVITVEDTNAD